MTKSELAKALANEKRLDLTNKKAIDIIETVFDLIVCNFQNGDPRMEIRGFGTLKVKQRKEFMSTNPQNGIPLHIAAKKSISFKPALEVRRRINA
jgi:integration host factor subunit beta